MDFIVGFATGLAVAGAIALYVTWRAVTNDSTKHEGKRKHVDPSDK